MCQLCFFACRNLWARKWPELSNKLPRHPIEEAVKPRYSHNRWNSQNGEWPVSALCPGVHEFTYYNHLGCTVLRLLICDCVYQYITIGKWYSYPETISKQDYRGMSKLSAPRLTVLSNKKKRTSNRQTIRWRSVLFIVSLEIVTTWSRMILTKI